MSFDSGSFRKDYINRIINRIMSQLYGHKYQLVVRVPSALAQRPLSTGDVLVAQLAPGIVHTQCRFGGCGSCLEVQQSLNGEPVGSRASRLTSWDTEAVLKACET